MLTIGLTGGIASGKSVVAQMLAARGATVVDVDRVAHETYRRGTPGFERVVAAFGPAVAGADGEVDRRVLGGRVFGRPEELKKLTDIVWPLTRSRLEEMKAERIAMGGVLVFEAAVLIEAGWTDLVDEVWVVAVPVAIARARLMARNGISEEQADARISSQLSNEERAGHADVTIDNSGDLAALERRVDEAWAALPARAARKESISVAGRQDNQ